MLTSSKTNIPLLLLILLISLQKLTTLHGHIPHANDLHIRPNNTAARTLKRTNSYITNGEQIALNFYLALEKADHAKDNLQNMLQNFLENLQRNLTTSAVLNTIASTNDTDMAHRHLQKLDSLSNFFHTASIFAQKFAHEVENGFETAKNESYASLLKLRQVTSTQRLLPIYIKTQLTAYFTEMQFFHVMFSEVLDEAMEYIVDTLQSTRRSFTTFADIQSDILRDWKFKPSEWCSNRYMDFLQHWSAEIFKCAAGNELTVAYDVYAMTEVTSKYIMRQIEFRIQRLYNCFYLGKYELRCRFLRYPEADFEQLFAKLDELQSYYDIKSHHGRVNTNRINRNRRDQQNVASQDKCIPHSFPDNQIPSNLRACFFFPQF